MLKADSKLAQHHLDKAKKSIFNKGNLKKAEPHCEKACTLYEKLVLKEKRYGLLENYIWAHELKALLQISHGNYSYADQIDSELISITDSFIKSGFYNLREPLAEVYNCKGQWLSAQGENDRAIRAFDQSIQILESTIPKSNYRMLSDGGTNILKADLTPFPMTIGELSLAYQLKGATLLEMNDLPQAAGCINKAIELLQEISEVKGLGNFNDIVKDNLATCFYYRGVALLFQGLNKGMYSDPGIFPGHSS